MYIRFNDLRKNKYKLITIKKSTNAQDIYLKRAHGVKSQKFLESLIEKYSYLSKNSQLRPVGCKMDGDDVVFDTAEGTIFSEILLEDIAHHDKAAFMTNWSRFDTLLKNEVTTTSEVGDEFTAVFGKDNSTAQWEMMVGCIDIAPTNLFIAPEGDTHALIDYEWTFDFTVPYKFVLWRALYLFYSNYREYNVGVKLVNLDTLYEEYNISREQRDLFVQWEYNFQHHTLEKVNVTLEQFLIQISELEQYSAPCNTEHLAATSKLLGMKNLLNKYDVFNLRKVFFVLSRSVKK